MTGERRGRVVAAGEGVALPFVAGEVLLPGDATAGRLAVLRSHAPAGDVVPAHVHHRADECFYLLDGEIEVTCGQDLLAAGPGSLVHLPSGIPHALRVGPAPASMLILAVPAGLEELFRELDDDDADVVELQHRHGVTFL